MLAAASRGLAMIGDDAETSDLRLLLLADQVTVLGELDRRAEAIQAARAGLVLAEQTGTPRLATARWALAEQQFLSGQWDDALTELDPAVAMPGPNYLPVMIHGLIALIAAHRADEDRAKGQLSGIPDWSDLSDAAAANAHYLLLARALLAERAGGYDEIAAILSIAIDPDLAEVMANRLELLPALARAALEVADEATLAAAAAVAAEEAERAQIPVRTAIADHCRGLMTGDPGPVLSAARYFGAAGRVLDHGAALEDAAVLAAMRGDRTAARQALASALAAYQALGADWDTRRASTRLRPFGLRARRPGHPERPVSGWDALTPTEVKVARLVAVGRSNPDIAAALFLSRYTVQTHVSHILAKLGAQSRAEIAAEAVRHGSAAERATA
jgi:DNA-binding CsgD family transcriptional regulator